MTWVKFHEELTMGAKRGLKRAHRFVYMELSMKARPLGGTIELGLGMADEAAVLDLLGGDAREVKDAIKALSSGSEPMIRFEGPVGARRLVVVSWDRWNDLPGASTERVKRHRERVATEVKRVTSPLPPRSETQPERSGNAPRVEESREEKEISPEPSVPLSPPENRAPPERRQAPRSQERPISGPARTIRDTLEASPRLRGVATNDFAGQLAAFAFESGSGGRFSLADVLTAIGEADDKLTTDAAVGEHTDRKTIARLVIGCVRTGPRRPSPANDSGPPVELPKSTNVVPPKGAVGGI